MSDKGNKRIYKLKERRGRMKKIVSIVLSFALLFSLFGCSNNKTTKYSKSFLDLFDTASSITAYDISQAKFDEKYNKFNKIKVLLMKTIDCNLLKRLG